MVISMQAKKFELYYKLTFLITFNRDSTTQVNTLCERELSIFRLVAPVLRFDKPCIFVDKYQQYYPIVHFINSILTAMSLTVSQMCELPLKNDNENYTFLSISFTSFILEIDSSVKFST
jgi:hypothetical protein